MKRVRTRIAPSPTGYMHIGTLHTALFNYFFTKQTGGQFILRIEDTDRAGFVDGATQKLIEMFDKLGLQIDEGPRVVDGVLVDNGSYGPYIQSKRLAIYKPFAQKLIEQKNAYHCFCSKERLDEMRKNQVETKQMPKYDRTCLGLTPDDIQKRLQNGEPHVIRLLVPDGETVVHDLIRGDIIFSHNDLDDQVIMKSDGFPTYHLAVVVDDHLMEISHVIRGEEWLPSTPKHILMQTMLGFEVPFYAHLPHLLNPDKTKLSKRQGDVAVEDYFKKGYVKEALINFVGILGFNPTSDREIFSVDELIKLFDLSKVKKSGAIMNHEKLDWMNNQYIKEMGEDEFFVRASEFVGDNVLDERSKRAMLIERQRVNRLDELPEHINVYKAVPVFDPSILVWKKANADDAVIQLKNLALHIEQMSENDFDNILEIEENIKKYIENNNLQNGNTLWPLRVALSGMEKSASPFELLWVLGREASLARINTAINLL